MKRLICLFSIALATYSCGIQELEDRISNRDTETTNEPRARKLNNTGDGTQEQEQQEVAELTYRNSCMYELKERHSSSLFLY